MDSHRQLATRYLAALIYNRGASKQFWLNPTYLDYPDQRAILSELHGMWQGGVTMTPELIMDRLLRNQVVAQTIGADRIFDFVSKSVNVQVEKHELHDLHNSLLRNYVYAKAQATLSELAGKLDTPEALDEAMATMRRLKAMAPEETANLAMQMQEAFEEAVGGSKGLIPFYIPPIDRHLGGLSRAEVAIIAGRPGHGKTSFATQLSTNWLDHDLRVFMVSKEMKTFRLLHKMISQKSHFTSRQLHRGELTEEEAILLAEKIKELTTRYEDRLFIHDDIYDVSRIETMVAKYRPDVIVDDFIQLTACDDANLRLEILRIMKAYKQIAKEYNCAVVTLSQLNRSIESRDDPVPRLSDLAESGAIEQLAADVLFVYYPHKVNLDAPADQVTVIASKTRYGTTGRFVLGFDGQHMRYREVPMAVA